MSAAAPYPRWLRRAASAVDAVTSVLNVTGTLLIVGLVFLVNTDVIGRAAFAAPLSGVPEMVSLSIVAIVFLQVAEAFRRGRMTRSDALLMALGRRSARGRAALELCFALAAGAITAILFSASLPLFEKAWARGTYTGTVGDFTAPVWPVKLILLIGCTALLAQSALHALRALWRLWTGAADDTV